MPRPAAEVDIDEALVRGLLEDQLPDLAGLPLRELDTGWDNVIYRLGEELVVRLPRREMSSVLVAHEQRWLPELAPALPLPIPAPVRAGKPGPGYPWTWSVCPWLPGEQIWTHPPNDWDEAARALGAFVAALHQPAPPDAPANPYRGVPLAERHARFFEGLDAIAGDPEASIDRPTAELLWHDLSATAPWPGPPLWLHGDLHALNVLVHHGRISAVIDFGDITGGDPATDLATAWITLPADARAAFRAAAGEPAADDDTWRRAGAWALAHGVACLGGDDPVRSMGRRTTLAVLADPPS